MDNYISVDNAFYSYSKTNALRNINLEIRKGESVALIGPNGSGKSTLLKLINGIITPDKGNYSFEGNKITVSVLRDTAKSKSFHSKIGFVMQSSDAQLFCTNVYEEIAFAPRQMGLSNDETSKRVEDCLGLLHLGHLRHTAPYHLSEGEKKKVAIASVLSMNPDVLALDEPMSGLDPKTKRFLRELIISLNKAGKTIICSTHDFVYVDGMFQSCLVFSEDHTIVRVGNYGEITNDIEFLKRQNII